MGEPLRCWCVHGCDELVIRCDGVWLCPNGCALRGYDDLSPWLRDHLTYVQTDPGMHARFFDPRSDR